MRIAIYVETDEDGHDEPALQVSVYVDQDATVVKTSFERCSSSEMPSLVSNVLRRAVGTATLGTAGR